MNTASSPNGLAQEIRNLSSTLREMKDEAGQFVQTRFRLLTSEMQEKLPNVKMAAIFAVVGALLLTTAYLLLTLALVSVAAVLFKDSDYRWVFALLGVGLLWLLIGGIALYFAKRELAVKGLAPTRTLEVLKGDKLWLEKEATS